MKSKQIKEMKISMKFTIYLVLIFCISCASHHKGRVVDEKISSNQKEIDFDVIPQKIAFGSCHKFESDVNIWSSIQAQNPDLWIWLGDIVYADTDDMEKLEHFYSRLKRSTPYNSFVHDVPVLGIWG